MAAIFVIFDKGYMVDNMFTLKTDPNLVLFAFHCQSEC